MTSNLPPKPVDAREPFPFGKTMVGAHRPNATSFARGSYLWCERKWRIVFEAGKVKEPEGTVLIVFPTSKHLRSDERNQLGQSRYH